jgi:hypothetical protein
MKIENEQLNKALAEMLLNDHDVSLCGAKFEVTVDSKGTLKIEHCRMYEFLKINFEMMEKLSTMFGSKKIDIDASEFWEGCETCDYGSQYFTRVIIKEADMSQWA